MKLLTVLLVLLSTFSITLQYESFYDLSINEVRINEDRVKVTLYYETLCPFCHAFVLNQLYPAFLKLQKAITIELVPFGNAQHYKQNGKWNFVCQHGAAECFGNKVHACILDQEMSFVNKMNYINCMTRQKNPVSIRAIQICGRSYSIPFEPVINCAESDEGDQLLAAMGDKTDELRPKLDKVPTVAFDDKYDKKLDYDARINLIATICTLLSNPHIHGCP